MLGFRKVKRHISYKDRNLLQEAELEPDEGVGMVENGGEEENVYHSRQPSQRSHRSRYRVNTGSDTYIYQMLTYTLTDIDTNADADFYADTETDKDAVMETGTSTYADVVKCTVTMY